MNVITMEQVLKHIAEKNKSLKKDGKAVLSSERKVSERGSNRYRERV